MSTEKNTSEIYGAREHNLKTSMLKSLEMNWLPLRDFLVLGKSSLALTPFFCRRTKTLYRNFFCLCSSVLGGLERPDVDKIEGLSPVIAIEQKTTNKNPRSTVGTVTELYDFLRLLFARVSDAYSLETGQKW